MGLFDFFKKTNTDNNVYEVDGVFEHILDVFFAFEEKYENRIVSLQIFPSRKVTGYVAFDIVFIFDGDIKAFKSSETEEMLEYFNVIEIDETLMTFECIRNTYEKSTNYEYIDKKLKSYVKHYMSLNQNIKFNLNKSGATIQYW